MVWSVFLFYIRCLRLTLETYLGDLPCQAMLNRLNAVSERKKNIKKTKVLKKSKGKETVVKIHIEGAETE